MKDRINVIPAPTWSWLDVNESPEAVSLPSPPDTGSCAAEFEISSLPAQVTVLPSVPDVCANIESGTGYVLDRFVSENWNAGCFIQVSGVSETPAVIKRTLSPEGRNSILNMTILAERGSSVTVMETCSGDGGSVSASLTRIYAMEGSVVNLIQVQTLDGGCGHWNGIGVKAEADSRVNITRIELGGKSTVLGAKALLTGQRSSYTLNTVYFGDNDKIIDINDDTIHIGYDTKCQMQTAGCLFDSSQKILRGTIDFREGAVRSVGHESEDVLLFSPDVRNRTAPLILCGEENVEGQHAATAGRIDETKLYYLCSRGLTPAQARRVMIEARFAPVLDLIPEEKLKSEITDIIGRRLDIHEGSLR